MPQNLQIGLANGSIESDDPPGDAALFHVLEGVVDLLQLQPLGHKVFQENSGLRLSPYSAV